MATSPRPKRPPVAEETLPAERLPEPSESAVVPELPPHDVPATADVGRLGRRSPNVAVS